MRASELPANPFAQRLDDRDGAADRSLEVERHAVLLGNGRQRDAVPGEQRFIGSDDGFFGCERRRDRRSRRITLSAHQFHEHVDLAIGRERHGIGDPAQLPAPDIALLAHAQGRKHPGRASATICNIRLYRLRPQRAKRSDGGGPHRGVRIFSLFGDERELVERCFATFAEDPQGRGLYLGRPVRMCFTSTATDVPLPPCSCRPPQLIAVLVSGDSF